MTMPAKQFVSILTVVHLIFFSLNYCGLVCFVLVVIYALIDAQHNTVILSTL